MTRRLIMASLRLPAVVRPSVRGFDVVPSPGGLACVLRHVGSDVPFTWIGWPGAVVDTEDQTRIRAQIQAAHPGAVPVYLEADEVHGFYRRASNELLWPVLLHLPQLIEFDEIAWRHYQAVNQRFADEIAAVASPEDAVWVHDYQLALVPKMLRDHGVTSAIGFFLHTPFPSWQTFRTLPVREEILRGMLGADLLGFQTYEYVDEFRRACLRILDIESKPESVPMPSHTTRLVALPVGVDCDHIRSLAQSPTCRSELAELEDRFAGVKVVLGVDRLDTTKGLPQKLLAFESFLDAHAGWRERVVFVQVASPSRTDMPDYQALKREVDEIVGRINGRHGSLTWTPVVYINRTLSLGQLAAFYQLADVLFVTSLRDGMNVVALEYVAARENHPGTLLLSELAGAASYLPGARPVNPYDPRQMSITLAESLSKGVSREAFEQMESFVETNTAAHWTQRFLSSLEATRRDQHEQRLRASALERKLRTAARPLFLLAYDGTLTPHVGIPAEAEPSAGILSALQRLSSWARIYVLSGRSADQLERWLGKLPIGLVCEHGLAIKEPGNPWPSGVRFTHEPLAPVVEEILGEITERTPGSWIEHKIGSITWHYRSVDPALRTARADELRQQLRSQLPADLAVIDGALEIDVCRREFSQEAAVRVILERHPDSDLVFAAGIDPSDNQLFDLLAAREASRSLICRVGSQRGSCQVESSQELRDLLERLASSRSVLGNAETAA